MRILKRNFLKSILIYFSIDLQHIFNVHINTFYHFLRYSEQES